MKTSILLLFLVALLGCNSKQTKRTSEIKEPSWAVKFAESVINEADSLIYYQREKPKYEYDYAFLGDAIYKLKDVDSKYAAYMKGYIDYLLHDDGEIDGHKMSDYNIDRVRPGNSMITLYKKYGDEKYKLGIETLVEQMKGQPRTNSQGFWHKKIYPYQMWLDGLYMGAPFYAQYVASFGDTSNFNDITNQFLLIEKYLKDEKTGLYYHGWDESKSIFWADPETGRSKNFWGYGVVLHGNN
jgi:unsaturated rhamnogalacturonyl hydrolase